MTAKRFSEKRQYDRLIYGLMLGLTAAVGIASFKVCRLYSGSEKTAGRQELMILEAKVSSDIRISFVVYKKKEENPSFIAKLSHKCYRRTYECLAYMS